MVTQALNARQYLEDLSTLPVKSWLIGPPGSAKTGSLEALLRMGLKLHLLSIDGNIRPLVQQVHMKCPDKIDNLDVVQIYQETQLDTFGRRSEATGSYTMDEIEAAIYKWPGNAPSDTSSWTAKEDVLAIDNLTNVTMAAVNQVRRLNNKVGGAPMDYGLWAAAHDRILNFYENLATNRWPCNVLCLAHVEYVEVEGATSEGSRIGFLRGFPDTIGKKLGAKIAGTFDTAILYESRPDGRWISTMPTRGVDVKVPLPDDLLGKELPVSDGLGEIFAALRAEPYVPLGKEKRKL